MTLAISPEQMTPGLKNATENSTAVLLPVRLYLLPGPDTALATVPASTAPPPPGEHPNSMDILVFLFLLPSNSFLGADFFNGHQLVQNLGRATGTEHTVAAHGCLRIGCMNTSGIYVCNVSPVLISF